MGNIQSWLNGPDKTMAKANPPQSAFGLILTLGPVLLSAGVLFLLFFLFKKSNRRWYAPRTYLGSLRDYERSPELPSGIFGSLKAFWKMPDALALRHQSLDAYLFLRFLRVCCFIPLVGALITWPVLFPVNATGGGHKSQLEILSWANINTDTGKSRHRLLAHAFIAWIFFGFVLYTIMRECIYYINLRQAFLLTPQNAGRISSRTVLFTSVPSPYLDEDRLRKLFSDSVKHVWIVYDTDRVDDLVKERNKVAMKLEQAEVKFLKLVNKETIKAAKKGSASEDKAIVPRDGEAGEIADRWIPRAKRPSHRLGFLGLVGKKVDTIEWCRNELQRLVPEAETAQRHYRAGGYDKIASVFIEFHTQSDAQAAYQVVTHHQALHMSPKYLGVQPEEVVWKSLKMSWMTKILRRYMVLAFIIALIIFWAIPVAIVGVISQVSTLVKVPFLRWLNHIPKPILGFISGLLPPILMNVLLSLVPIIMRFCGRLSGEVSASNVELFTQKAYFAFMFIQLFLVRTLGDTASTLLVNISQNPGSVFPTLSSAIPTSSNFYISYFLVQGFTIAAGVVTQVVGLLIFRVLYKFIATTPRKMYVKWTSLSALLWGSLLPLFTNMAVISIVFAIIAPLELLFAALAHGLFYLAYRYNVFFVTATKVDTRGLIYPTALTQLLAGVYIGEICLVGMFIVSRAWAPVALMVVFLIFTILFHRQLKKALYPLMFNLPRNILVEEESVVVDLSGTIGVDPGLQEEARVGSVVTAGRNNGVNQKPNSAIAPPPKKPGALMRFLKPWQYADYPTLRALVPHENIDISAYKESTEADAYYPPSVVDDAPLLWIPEDSAGVSKQEIAHTSKVIPITDEGCSLNDHNRIVWDEVGARPPLWDEKVWY